MKVYDKQFVFMVFNPDTKKNQNVEEKNHEICEKCFVCVSVCFLKPPLSPSVFQNHWFMHENDLYSFVLKPFSVQFINRLYNNHS